MSAIPCSGAIGWRRSIRSRRNWPCAPPAPNWSWRQRSWRTRPPTEVRQRTLFERKVVSSADVEAAVQTREAAVATAAQAQANLKVAEEQLGYTRILADFDGVVTAVGAEVGQVVSPGETVVTVARPDRREAVIDIPAELVGVLRTGSRFEVALELDPAVRAEGAVREIAPQADPVSRTQRVWIGLKDPCAELPPRHYGEGGADRAGARRHGSSGLGAARARRQDLRLGGRSGCRHGHAGRS